MPCQDEGVLFHWHDEARFPKQEHLLLDLHFQKLLTTLFLFQAFDTDNLTIQRQRGQSHPPPVHRAMLLDAALRDTFPGRYGLPKREVEKIHAEAWGEAAIAARAAKLAANRWWDPRAGPWADGPTRAWCVTISTAWSRAWTGSWRRYRTISSSQPGAPARQPGIASLTRFKARG